MGEAARVKDIARGATFGVIELDRAMQEAMSAILLVAGKIRLAETGICFTTAWILEDG